MPDEWDGKTERRMTDRRQTDILAEFTAVRASLDKMSGAITKAFPEQRVREIIAYEQRQSRRGLIASILIPVLAAFAAATVIIFVQAESNGDTLSEAKVTADYVRDCLQHSDRLTPAERTQRCGRQEGGTSRAVLALVEFQKCAFLILPENRTDENMDGCVAQAMKKLGG